MLLGDLEGADVGVESGRVHSLVAQEALNLYEIRPVGQQMGGDGAAQHVRRDPPQPHEAGTLPDHLGDPLPLKPLAPGPDEEGALLRTACQVGTPLLQVAGQRGG